MKVLIFGPAGVGKTYVSSALKTLGINAFDADEIEGLSSWYDRDGKKVATPKNAEEVFAKHYSFLWSRTFLKAFLAQYPDVYLFGGSGNVTAMFDLFEKVYFLKVEANLQKERLTHSSRKNAMNEVRWGQWLETDARNRGVPFIDASLTPEQIFTLINK
ncbi:hypothetical protein KDA_52370 [Dictyobacter alpinus]|uniref:Shikimate kinase n=1 Tax=Dictyobacter alpinus TaxID=2014873 RepID=A0A402BEE1_9CHLR|nr:hypothetical protein [Dictyobacter alpinus]GCE29753.1 hypothetical protein KDA_52370 [Dictyobacter alpinus]